MKYGIISICISLAFVAGCLSGIENTKESQVPEITRLWNEPPQTVILTNSSGAALPLFAPIVANNRIRIDINNTEGAIGAADISLFSSRLAITFWNESDEAIVVDSYKNVLISSPIAYMKNIPILVYGETTKNALKLLGCSEIVAVGNIPLAGTAALRNNTEVYSYVIQTAKELSINLNYVTLVNSNDRNSSSPYLSGVGSLLNAYRHGIVVDVTNGFFKKLYVTSSGFSEIRNNLTQIYGILNESGMKIEHVCIVGRPDAVPYVNLGEMVNGYGDTLNDHFYGCTSQKKSWSTPDFAVGRFMASNVIKGIELMNRYVFYTDCLEQGADTVADPPISSRWMDRSIIIINDDLLPDIVTLQTCTEMTRAFLDGKFTHIELIYGGGMGKDIVVEQVKNSNVIYTHYLLYSEQDGNGNVVPGWTPISSDSNPIIFSTVTTGVVEPTYIEKQDAFIQKNIDSGICAFVTNTGAGMIGCSKNWIPTAPNYMNEVQLDFFSNLIYKNSTVGKALFDAKISYFNESINDPSPSDNIVLTGLTLYGDPAFNPYEPCNEGSQ